MGKMKDIALEYKEANEHEGYEEQRALLLSQGYERDEVDEIIQEMINEYNYEMAVDHGDGSVTNEN